MSRVENNENQVYFLLIHPWIVLFHYGKNIQIQTILVAWTFIPRKAEDMPRHSWSLCLDRLRFWSHNYTGQGSGQTEWLLPTTLHTQIFLNEMEFWHRQRQTQMCIKNLNRSQFIYSLQTVPKRTLKCSKPQLFLCSQNNYNLILSIYVFIKYSLIANLNSWVKVKTYTQSP